MKKKKSGMNQNRKRMMLIPLIIVIMSIALFVSVFYQNQTSVPKTDHFALTSTALIGQVTKQAIVLTDVALGLTTLTPSQTPVPIDTLQEQWLQEIETSLGFSHPTLNQVVSQLTLAYRNDVERSNNSSLNSDIRRYNTEGANYIVIIIQTKFYDIPNSGNLLVFRVKDATEKVIYNSPVGSSYFLWYESYGDLYDLNGNGYMDLALAHSNGTDCTTSRLKILEFKDDEIHDISPIESEQVDAHLFSYSIENSNNDSILEIVYQLPFIYKGDSDSQPCRLSNEVFQYQWNGERYALVNQP